MQRWYRLRLRSPGTAPSTLAWAPEEALVRRDDLVYSCIIKRVTDLHVESAHQDDGNWHAGSWRARHRDRSVGDHGRCQNRVMRGFLSSSAMRAASSPAADVILPGDIRKGDAMLIEDGMALRSAPHADADVVARSRAGQIAVVAETATLRWGRVAIKDRGDVWWPVEDNALVGNSPHVVSELPKFKTSELFLHRKIHDIASSPLIPNLKILSAQGVFRTIDGDEWEKIPQFRDANYPVAITETGRIYVGTFASDDQGETFHSFLRIENVVSPLRRRWNTNPKRMRILEINPQSADGQRLLLKVDIGLDFPVTIATSDQGLTWSAL